MKHYTPTLITPPEALVSLDEIKAHCRVVWDDEDNILAGFVSAATAHLDGEAGLLGRCIAEQTWQITLDAFPTSAIELRPGKVTEISSIAYDQKSDGEVVSMSPSDFHLYNDTYGSFVVPAKGASWPETEDVYSAVQIQFVSGLPVSDVRADLKLCVKLLAAHFYEHREAVEVGQVNVEELPLGLQHMIGVQRERRF